MKFARYVTILTVAVKTTSLTWIRIRYLQDTQVRTQCLFLAIHFYYHKDDRLQNGKRHICQCSASLRMYLDMNNRLFLVITAAWRNASTIFVDGMTALSPRPQVTMQMQITRSLRIISQPLDLILNCRPLLIMWTSLPLARTRIVPISMRMEMLTAWILAVVPPYLQLDRTLESTVRQGEVCA